MSSVTGNMLHFLLVCVIDWIRYSHANQPETGPDYPGWHKAPVDYAA